MKKRIISLFFCIIVLLPALAGCHGAREQNSFVIPDEFDTSRNYEITFWAKNDTNMAQVETYEKAMEEFHALYPNITVTMRPFTDYGKLYNEVITNISTQTTPNVCITYPDHIATYLTGENTVVPLDDLMADKAYGLGGSEVKFDAPTVEEIIPQFLAEGIIGGQQYALPYMRSTEACYINKTYVEKLGYTVPDVLTWDFIWEVSAAAAEKAEDGTYLVNGQKVMIPFIYKSTDNMMIQMLRQKNAGYSTDAGEILIFNDTTEEILLDVADAVSKGAFSTFKISSYPANFLNAGQCVFAIDSTAGATWMGSGAPLMDISEEAVVEFETVVRMIPQYDPDNPVMISQGPSVCIFNKEDPQEILASWLFVQYLLTDDIQISYAQTEGYVPVTSKALENPVYQDYLSRKGEEHPKKFYYETKIEATELLLDNIENTFVTPVFNGSTSLRNAAGQLIEDVTKSVRRKKTIDDAYFETLYADTTSLYRLDQHSESSAEQADLGPLPTTAVVLLSSLAGAWVLIILYVCIQKINAKKLSGIS
ncbi:MAG: extracellular solute-binding protein [Clostridia bacterium]|nr:extracellular solute-binding protein [Clostridia bacterium]